MSDQEKQTENTSQPDVRNVVRHVIEEFMRAEQSKAEPAYKAELVEERKRREALESRLNQLVEENRQARATAEQVDRYSQIKSELQRLGVAKLDLAFKAVKDDIVRTEDGRLVASDGVDHRPVQDYLRKFVEENPELLPARIAGGSGASSTTRNAVPTASSAVDIDKIKPGMSRDEMERVRQEVARLASQALRGM
jgi:vacuolar-type H+-ATPase subunit I/STV1